MTWRLRDCYRESTGEGKVYERVLISTRECDSRDERSDYFGHREQPRLVVLQLKVLIYEPKRTGPLQVQ
jgi:hypothetical protein